MQGTAELTPASALNSSRRLPVGAEVLTTGGAHFRVWAPNSRRVDVMLEHGADDEPHATLCFPLQAEANGYFSGLVRAAGAGTLYRYRLDGSEQAYPDPASRFQPHGPHGPSQVIDPTQFKWTDRTWRGCRREGQVIYEMHIGTFTRRGTWEAATHELTELADLGITLLEVMPVAEFAGRYGWGYDGVDWFAPTRLYGTPDDFRRFVDTAHGLGMGVILDVVYNHIGPDGNYLPRYSPDYFSERYTTDWGAAINFDGPNSGPVRELVLANAGYWIDEFHLDGLRLDATQNIYDTSPEHIVSAITRHVRRVGKNRSTFIVAENEPQHARLVQTPEDGGYGMDALWNDDFHHSAMVALTGRNEAYYTDYLGRPQEFISVMKWGYLYQGQYYHWQKQRRGTPAFNLPPASFVLFIQNHDQVANSGYGRRVHQLTSPGRYRAMTALLLLAPGTPMLFQGQEFAASTPFLYFADHKEALAGSVSKGRAEFLAQFRNLATAEMQAELPDPCRLETFQRSQLDLAERERHAEAYALHRDLLRLRRTDPVFAAQRQGGVDGAVLGAEAFVLRFFSPRSHDDDRLLIVNFGTDLHLTPVPEPLLAPPQDRMWRVSWSSEDPRYGGHGTAPPESEGQWHLAGHAAVVLEAVQPLPIDKERE